MIEVVLDTALREQRFLIDDPSPKNTVRGVKETLDERGGSIDHSGLALGDSSGMSQGEHAYYRPSWNRPRIF
jgi:hypothetical protein